MRRYRFSFVLMAALLATGGRAPGQDPLAAVFARIDAAASRFKGLAANIRRVDHEEVIHEEDVETGTIRVKSRCTSWERRNRWWISTWRWDSGGARSTCGQPMSSTSAARRPWRVRQPRG